MLLQFLLSVNIPIALCLHPLHWWHCSASLSTAKQEKMVMARKKKGAVVQVFPAIQRRNETDYGSDGSSTTGRERTQREACTFCYIYKKNLRSCQDLQHSLKSAMSWWAILTRLHVLFMHDTHTQKQSEGRSSLLWCHLPLLLTSHISASWPDK